MMKMNDKIFVVTDSEGGWDNVEDVYRCEDQMKLRLFLLQDLPDEEWGSWEDRYVISEMNNGIIDV